MNVAKGIGQSGRVAVYAVPDDQLAVGSTLGAPKVTIVIKASGALEKVFSIDWGEVVFGTMILRHYEAVTGMYLGQDQVGTFYIHPEHQEHAYLFPNNVSVHEDIFVLNSRTEHTADATVDPPGVYQTVQLTNNGYEAVEIITYAYAVLRGHTEHDVEATYDPELGAIIAWNTSKPNQTRIFGCSLKPETWETTLDYARAVSESCPGPLSCTTDAPFDPLGVLQFRSRIDPGDTHSFYFLLSFGEGRDGAEKNYRVCPSGGDALEATKSFYHDLLSRSVVYTPDRQVNQGVLWSKANMLRIETKAPTGWSFTNDPTRSNNSVSRDTAWFGFGGDYVTPDFVRESLLAYVRYQERDGMFVEYYDIRTGQTEDYGLNINDDTPLVIMALWHHYNVTGDVDFLREVYPAAAKAARYILSQRNHQGLVWCTATGVSDWGIVGWRNVIPNYRLSGATTEVNSECYAALDTVSHMARVLEKHNESEEFSREARALKEAINTHLYNPENGLYYLHIDLDNHPRSDVTSDLVFPVMFGVADDRTSANIIGRLSNQDFWTTAGIRTSSRDAPNYTPNGGWGLLGGVWVGVSFWYAFAAAKYAPGFMAHALSTSFENYSRDPRQHNTVPGQFSEWLNGETLVNQGMMLSPWFPPRYLWAAVEGMAGFTVTRGRPRLSPRLPADWKWMAVQHLPYRGQHLTWFVARMPDLEIYTNFISPADQTPYVTYEEDITGDMRATGDSVCEIGLREGENLLLFVGNTEDKTITTSVSVRRELSGSFRLRVYDSLLDQWTAEEELVPADKVKRGIAVKLESQGFCVLELQQAV